jgi:molybdopterin/thiamine biosynthesis adenylyltransferase
MQTIRKIKIIGAGGIGCYLIDGLARYVSYNSENAEITIIDGDSYEEKNRERQKFVNQQNKATEMVALNKSSFPKIHFKACPSYVTEDNVVTLIRENDYVMLCVDNHATRKIVSQRCSELSNVTLISGGNDLTDGNVIVYIRKNDKDLNKSPIDLYPSIANPKDINPGDLKEIERQGCQREAVDNPQLVPTNMCAAAIMLSCYRLCDTGKFDTTKEQVYFDIDTLAQRVSPQTF